MIVGLSLVDATINIPITLTASITDINNVISYFLRYPSVFFDAFFSLALFFAEILNFFRRLSSNTGCVTEIGRISLLLMDGF